MRKKPKELIALSLFFGAIAVGMPLQIMFMYGHTPLEGVAIMAKLAPLNWAVMVLAAASALLAYHGSPYCLAVVPMLSYTVIQNNWLVAEIGSDFSPFVAGLGTLGYFAGCSPIFTKRVRDVLLNPERRWWFTPHRRRVQMPVLIGNDGLEFISSTFDLSETGAFIVGRPQLAGIKPGRVFYIFFDLKRSQRIQCRAQVVRNVGARGNYPEGVGVRFLDIGPRERELLAEFTRENAVAKSAPDQAQAA